MSKVPAISIICPSYNHGSTVDAFLDSLFAQTVSCFEVIIIDDASTDNNLSAIRARKDPRIRLVAREANRGFCASLNEGIQLAQGDIVAFLASDDLANPHFLERILDAFSSSPTAVAVYVELDRMSPDGESLGRPGRLPVQSGRHELLRNSFLGHNQLPSPGMALRRDVALSLLLPEGSVQYSDWILQNRLLMRGEIVMLEEQLVRYRVSSTSLSARSVASIARDALETRIMMDDFLTIKDIDFLVRTFPGEMSHFRSLPAKHIPYILGRLALLSEIPEKRCWGYETIMRHLSDPGVAESLYAHAGFTHKDLMAITPTESAALVNEVRTLRRSVRHLRRIAIACALVALLALWLALR